MKIIKYYYFLVAFSILNLAKATEINIDNTITEKALPKFFTGAGIGSVSSMLNHNLNEEQNTIVQTFLNPEFLKICKALKIADYRFPAGTSGNYYHFYGKGGGADTSEVFCNSTYYGIKNPAKLKEFINAYKFEQNLDKNYAYYFADFMQEIQKEVPDAGFYYHLNSHTHIYRGQLKQLTSSIQQLINQYFDNNYSLLNQKFSTIINTIDTNQIKTAIDVLDKLKTDNRIELLKQQLLNDTDFEYRFQENINSIRFFKSKNITIKGIEIGNETEAEYMLFDDDFTHFPYDCNSSADTITENPFSKLLFRDYLEGLLKNWILTTLYADSIHADFNIPVGLTISGFRASAGFDKNSEPILLNPFGALEKRAFFWSKFFGNESKIDAYIPHIYSQKVLECNDYTAALDSIPADKINETALKVIQAFSDITLPYHLKYISQTVSGKPLWLTEWNFNMHSFVPNTFMHAYFLHRTIGKNIELYEKNLYNVQSWLLHYLTDTYFAFALIKAGYFGKNYILEKMLPYEAFQIWGNTLNDNSKKLQTNFSSKNGHASDIQTFINGQKNKIYIHYNNVSELNDYLDLENILIKDKDKNYDIKAVSTYILTAKTLLASNYVDCKAVKNQIPNDSYKVITDTLNKNTDTIKIPAKSLGCITLEIKEQIPTKQKQIKKKAKDVKIYPNPSSEWLNIEIENYNNAEEYTLNIYNLSGENILSVSNMEKLHKLDINNLPSGIYILNIQNNTEAFISKKIVKK